jgi:hypothetical protein
VPEWALCEPILLHPASVHCNNPQSEYTREQVDAVPHIDADSPAAAV